MIVSHLNAIEKVLIAQSEIAKNAGHPNLRGGHENGSFKNIWKITFQPLVATLAATPDELVEMIIVLGKGIAWRINAFEEFDLKKPIPPDKHWAYFDSKDNNLYAMFTHMLTWVSSSSPAPDVSGYASHVYFQEVKII